MSIYPIDPLRQYYTHESLHERKVQKLETERSFQDVFEKIRERTYQRNEQSFSFDQWDKEYQQMLENEKRLDIIQLLATFRFTKQDYARLTRLQKELAAITGRYEHFTPPARFP